MTTPAAAQPRESGRHLWDPLRRSEGLLVLLAKGTGCARRGHGSRAGGDLGEGDRLSADPGGDRGPQGGSFTDRDMRSVPALDIRSNLLLFSGLVGDVGVSPSMTPAPEEAYAINIQGCRCSPNFGIRSSRLVTKWQPPPPRGILGCLGWTRSTSVVRLHLWTPSLPLRRQGYEGAADAV